MKKISISRDAADLLGILRKFGRGNNKAMSIGQITQAHDYTRRQLQRAKLELLQNNYLIGSTPGRHHGIFLCRSIKDLKIAARPMKSQINAMRRGYRTLTESKRARKICGQRRLVVE